MVALDRQQVAEQEAYLPRSRFSPGSMLVIYQLTAASRTPNTRGGHEAASSIVSCEPSHPLVGLGGQPRCLQATTRYAASAVGLQRKEAGLAAVLYSMSRLPRPLPRDPIGGPHLSAGRHSRTLDGCR